MRERHAVAQGRAGPVTDADGTCHRKVEHDHVRHLATVFGTVRVTRCAWRADAARNLHPADAALNLPQRLHSHTLRRRAATEAARGSFGAAQQALTRACGKVAGKRQVEQLTVAAASDIDAFYQAAAPQPATDDTLLVLSVDGKGVVVRPEALREATRKAAAAKGAGRYRTRLAGGEEQGRKRVATLGSSTTPTPHPAGPTTSSRRSSPSTPPQRWGWSAAPPGSGRHGKAADRLGRHHQRAGHRGRVRPGHPA